MSQVMSPLGALLVNTTATNPGTTSPTGTTSSLNNLNCLSSSIGHGHHIPHDIDHHDQVLKLMSVSLLNESSRALNFHHSLALTLATANCRPAIAAAAPTNNSKMTFKSSSSPTMAISADHNHHQIIRPDSTGSPSSMTNGRPPFIEDHYSRSPVLNNRSPSRSPNIGTTITAAISQNNNITNGTGMNDEDEVLSIGRDDDQVLLDCDSSSLMSEEEELMRTNSKDRRRSNGNDDDNDNSGSDDLISNPSPSPAHLAQENCKIYAKSHDSSRTRNYSSEDCSSVKSLPFSLSLSEAIMKQQHHQHQQLSRQQQTTLQQHQTSLMFSIANILRPDFGAAKSPPNHNNSHKPRKHHHLNPHGPSALKRPSKTLPGSLNNKLQRRHEPIIPIDLSRPSSNGSPLPLPLPLPLPKLPTTGRTHKSSGASNNRRTSSSANNNVSRAERENSSSIKSSPGNNPTSPTTTTTTTEKSAGSPNNDLWPAWVYCTRYSDRPSSGPRSRRGRKKEKEIDEKRPRTAFTAEQLSRLKKEFEENRYLTEKRRQDLARDLRLHENQIKIWFQNKRAKLKKSTGQRGGLALQLMAQGLYNHSTIPSKGCGQDDDDSD